jgi:manganese/zinc/iron transport system permease protein
LFALGTLLVSKFFADVHLDTDAILYGEIAFAPFDRLIIAGRDWGAQPLYFLGALTILNIGFILVFYKELKLATFDPAFAATIGFAPVLLHYALMTMVSITTVGAFTAVGAILVVAFLIVPPATAYLLTDRLPMMIGISMIIGIIAAVIGCLVAIAIDASPAGSMATTAGVCFGLAVLFGPQHGVLAQAQLRAGQRRRFATEMLVVHLAHHEGTTSQSQENSLQHLQVELRWKPQFAMAVVRRAQNAGLIQIDHEQLLLTDAGRQIAHQVMARRTEVGSVATGGRRNENQEPLTI